LDRIPPRGESFFNYRNARSTGSGESNLLSLAKILFMELRGV
jgi:hypothetical protein